MNHFSFSFVPNFAVSTRSKKEMIDFLSRPLSLFGHFYKDFSDFLWKSTCTNITLRSQSFMVV